MVQWVFGKSIDLLKVAYNYEQRGHKVMLLTAKVDTRAGEDVIATRIGLKREAKVFLNNTNVYELLIKQEKNIDCILVDEAQFLTENQVDELGDIVDKLGIPVICYGIRNDFTTKVFEGSKRLLEIADKIEEIKTICVCGKKAIYSARYLNGEIVTKGEQIQIGDLEYKSLCRKCYKKEISDKEEKYSLIVGRFEPIHKGHEKLIQLGLDKKTKVVIYVTENKLDIIPVQKRIELINILYKEQIEKGYIIVRKYINEEFRNQEYGMHIFDTFKKEFGKKPSILIYGSDKNLEKCFSKELLKDVETVASKRDGISATIVREYLRTKEYQKLKLIVNEKIFNEIKVLKV